MIVNGRTVELKENFTTQLAAIQEYISQYDPIKGRELATNIANYALDVIAPNPYIFAEYKGRPTPEKMYRRAVFGRKYVIFTRLRMSRSYFWRFITPAKTRTLSRRTSNHSPNFSNRRYSACRDRPSSRATSVMLPW